MRPEHTPTIDHAQTLTSRLYEAATNLRHNLSRIAASGLLILTGATASFTAYEANTERPAYADTGGYPEWDAPCYPSSIRDNPDGSKWCAGYDWRVPSKDANGNIAGWPEWTGRTYGARNCTDYVAWRTSQALGKTIGNLGHATSWNNNAPSKGFLVDTEPEVGDIAQFEGDDAHPNDKPGHVAFVEKVNSDDTVEVSEYNHNVDGYGHPNGSFGRRTISNSSITSFIDVNGPNDSNFSLGGETTPSSPNNTVLKVIKKNDNGTNLVFWAKPGTVFETSWRSGTAPQHAQVTHIPQDDIKDFEVQVNPDGQRLIYTAAGEHIYEANYYPGGALRENTLIANAGKVLDVEKTVGPNGEQQLYVMTPGGIDEYWWYPNQPLHKNRLYTIKDPIAMEKVPTKPDGTQILYVADKSYVYENYWKPGLGLVTGGVVMHIPQADIRDMDISIDPDGKHRAYVGRARDGVWEGSWYRGQPVATRQITGDNGIRDIEAGKNGNTNTVYVATEGGVFEYWWQDGQQSQGAAITAQPDIRSIDRSTTADGYPAIYTASGTKVYESYWGTGQPIKTATVA